MESSPSLFCLCHPISSASVGGTRQFVFQITSMDVIFVGYWVAGQARAMMSRVMYKSNFIIGNMIIRKVFMIPCDMFLRSHLINTRSISILRSGRGRVCGLGDEL